MSEVKSSADVRKEFGKYMQTERDSRGITQKFLAKKIGITETQLSRIETGKSGTNRDTVIKWAECLSIDENEVLRKFKPEYNILPDEIASLNLEGLDQNDIVEIAEFIEFKKMRKRKTELGDVNDEFEISEYEEELKSRPKK